MIMYELKLCTGNCCIQAVLTHSEVVKWTRHSDKCAFSSNIKNH